MNFFSCPWLNHRRKHLIDSEMMDVIFVTSLQPCTAVTGLHDEGSWLCSELCFACRFAWRDVVGCPVCFSSVCVVFSSPSHFISRVTGPVAIPVSHWLPVSLAICFEWTQWPLSSWVGRTIGWEQHSVQHMHVLPMSFSTPVSLYNPKFGWGEMEFTNCSCAPIASTISSGPLRPWTGQAVTENGWGDGNCP